MYEKLSDDFGYIRLTEQYDPHAMMDIGIYHMKKRETVQLYDEVNETVVLPLEAHVRLNWENKEISVKRSSVFDEPPYCLHVAKGVEIQIESLDESYVLIQKTANHKEFPSKLYLPEQCKSEELGAGLWNETAFRTIRTIFDYTSAPYSNLVIGEVISHPGKWSSYPPHTHPQPEVYYYQFDKRQGFGCVMVEQDAYRIEHHSYLKIPGNLDHPQSTAPGYAMYFCWMIRHLENNPWTERIFKKEHQWLMENSPVIWPEKNN